MKSHEYSYMYAHLPICVYKILISFLQLQIAAKIDLSYAKLDVVPNRVELNNSATR